MSHCVLRSPSNRYKHNKNYKCSALHTSHEGAHHQIYQCNQCRDDDMFALLLAVHLPGSSPQGTNYPGQHPPHTTTTPLWLSQCPLVQYAVCRSGYTVYSAVLAVHDMQCAASILCPVSSVQPLHLYYAPPCPLVQCLLYCVVCMCNFE